MKKGFLSFELVFISLSRERERKERVGRETNFNQNHQHGTRKKVVKKSCIFFPTFHLSGHKIFAPERPCLRARIHFAFCITPSSPRSLRVPSCPLLPDISSGEERRRTDRRRDGERVEKNNERTRGG